MVDLNGGGVTTPWGSSSHLRVTGMSDITSSSGWCLDFLHPPFSPSVEERKMISFLCCLNLILLMRVNGSGAGFRRPGTKKMDVWMS